MTKLSRPSELNLSIEQASIEPSSMDLSGSLLVLPFDAVNNSKPIEAELKPQILIVDDEAINIEVIEMMLSLLSNFVKP